MSESTAFIEISTSRREELVDITKKVAAAVNGRGDGICLVSCPHSTACIYINENESGLRQDVLDMLDHVVPANGWAHDRIDHNARAHLKSTLIGLSKAIPLRNGRLLLGTWQQIFFAEFDGPRKRRVAVTVAGGE